MVTDGFNPHTSILTTSELLFALVPPDADRVYGDEGVPADPDNAPRELGEVVGHRRILRDNEAGNVALTLYENNKRAQMTAIVNDILGGPGDILTGHVTFSVGDESINEPQLSGSIYVSETTNFAHLNVRHDYEGSVSSASRPSFVLAREVGLGDVWTESVFDYVADASKATQNIGVLLDAPQTAKLNQSLTAYLSPQG